MIICYYLKMQIHLQSFLRSIMNMGIKNNLHSQNNVPLIMVICEEHNTLRTLFDDLEPSDDGKTYIDSQEFQIMSLRSRYNPEIQYYLVNCEAYKRYGYTSDELFEEIEKKYIESGYESLDELFTFIERI